MTKILEANGASLNPAYAEALNFLAGFAQRQKIKSAIRTIIEENYGSFINKGDKSKVAVPFHMYENLLDQSSDVAWLVSGPTGGQIKDIPNKDRKDMHYSLGKNVRKIATKRSKEYCYVIDQDEMVWDPMTSNFGTRSEAEYLAMISNG